MIQLSDYRHGLILSPEEIIRLIDYIEKMWEKEGLIKMFDAAQEAETFDLLMKFREIRHKASLGDFS